ncbi:MAG: 2-hydroxycarboxylate transporter family protein [Fluviibacter sp.]
MNLLKKILTARIGPFPLTLLAIIVLILLIASEQNLLSDDVIGGLAALMTTGYILSNLGARIPGLNRLGGPAILCVLVPSLFLGYHLIPPDATKTIHTALDRDNILYLYIASLVVGSILGIDRRAIERHVLVHKVSKRFLPLIAGSMAAAIVAPLIGMLFGINPWHSFLFIVTPILSGGLGEGILPLALAYSEITHKSRIELSSFMIPAALIANLCAIMAASMLNWFGERYPSFTKSQDQIQASIEPNDLEDNTPINIELMGAGILLICTLYTLGRLLSPIVSLPATIAMILVVVILKLLKVFPVEIETGAYQVYKAVSKALTPAILVGMSVLYIPWQVLVQVIEPGFLAVCISTVLTTVGTGFIVGRLLQISPVDSAIICACHSGFGSSGNMAILGASKRQRLMPFAEVAISLGGAVMVIAATLLLRWFWPQISSAL